MKKLFICIMTFFIYIFSFADSHQDYNLFIKGKNNYYSGNFNEARREFETLMRTFSSSAVFDGNYAYFFIGMTYYELKDYKNAALYLEKAVYIPPKVLFNTDTEIEKDIFFSERDYSLGDSLIKTGDTEKGIIYLKRVDYSTYFPFVAEYEEKALKLLANYLPEAQDKIDLKFDYDFSKIPDMPLEELVKIGDFYSSQKNYTKAEEFYEYILKNIQMKSYGEIFNKKYLKVLIHTKNYKKIIKYTENPPAEYKDLYNFYRGLAYYRMKDFTRALFLFEGITDKNYVSEARYYSAGIYFALGDYKSTIENAKKITSKSIISESMLAFSYLYLNNTPMFEKTAENIISRYSDTYVATYFHLLMSGEKDIPTHITSLQDLSIIVSEIIKDGKPLPKDFFKRSDLLEMEQLTEIAKYGDKELLQFSFDRGAFSNRDNPAYGYSTTCVLENGKFYSMALNNSMNYMRQFFSYTELMKYIYPLYYRDIVDTCSKKYDVPQEMIYTIMHNISQFNPYYVSEDSTFGLMGISYSDGTGETIFEMFDPQINVEIGTRILKKYLDKYDGNKLKALIAYINGEKYVSSLYFNDNNDLSFNSIVIPEERYFLENLFLTYVFYSKLYEY